MPKLPPAYEPFDPGSGNGSPADSKLAQFKALLESDPQLALKIAQGITSKKFIPHPAQQQVMEAPARFKIMCAGRRLGKGVAPNTLLPTPIGFQQAKDIIIGDYLFGQDGKPTKVIGVYQHANRPMYRITFSDNAQIEVCEDHLWEVKDRNHRSSRIIDTKTIAETFIKPRKDGKLEHRWKLIRGEPVEFGPKNLPLDPYLIGILLGDGNIKRSVGFASNDPDIIMRICRIARKEGGRVSYYGKYDYGITRILTKLRDLELLGHGFATKFIPKDYMEGSIEQRLELLRGLMDSDGSVIRKNNQTGGMAEFASGSEMLAIQVQQLVRSLAGWASITMRTTQSGNPGWRVNIAMQLNPFWTPRKANIYAPKKKPTRAIIDIKQIQNGPMVCFEVEHPRKLFYVGKEYILTHNTKVAAAIGHRKARRNGKMVWWIAPTYKVVKRGYAEVLRQLPKDVLAAPAPPETAFDGGRSVVLRFKTGSRMEFYSAERPEGMLGEGVDLAILDEAATMPEHIWTQIVRPTLADRQGEGLFISTPRGRNWFYKLFLMGQDALKEDYASWRFPSMMNPYIPAEEWLEMEQTLPRAIYEQEILAEFISNAASVFRISDSAIRPIQRPEGHVVLGIDLAKHHDFTVLAGVNAGNRQPCYHERFNTVSWPEQRRRIHDAVAKIENSGATGITVMIDSTGIGDVIYDDLSLEGLDTVPIKFTPQWKQMAIMLLAADLERGNAFVHEAQLREFESYAYEITNAGRWKFEAASGNDDEVSAMLLAHWGIVNEGVPDIKLLSAADSPGSENFWEAEDGYVDGEVVEETIDLTPPSGRELLRAGYW